MNFNLEEYKSIIFSDLPENKFNDIALQAFKYQYKYNNVYNSYCNYLNINPDLVNSLCEIPFLPIEFFKSKKIVTGDLPIHEIFTSSSTTGSIPSKHYVTDIDMYVKSFVEGFKRFYGSPEEYCILGLLPSYLERDGSSLIYMVNKLISLSGNPLSGFFLNDFSGLNKTINKLEISNTKYILIGVSFGLLDFCEQYKHNAGNGIIMETGGMKGRRKELVREELHAILREAFNVENIHSEYGMTELLSQAYSKSQGIFFCPPWMRVLVREIEDPLMLRQIGNGGINIIDLANINSCCFIATSDLGAVYADKSFSVSGRIDNSDIRGCNLMAL